MFPKTPFPQRCLPIPDSNGHEHITSCLFYCFIYRDWWFLPDSNVEMENVKFYPWVGLNYKTGGIFDKKIMALGASHYCEDKIDANPCLTTRVVVRHLLRDVVEPWMNTYTNFERSLVNETTDAQMRCKIWNSLLFYNYVQEPMDNRMAKPSRSQYIHSASAFLEVLNKYHPDCCLVWGKTLWYNLPKENWEEAGVIVLDGKEHFRGTYILNDGTKVPFLCIKHPAQGYAWDYMHRVINEFFYNI